MTTGRVLQALGGLEFALGRDHLGATLALGLCLARHRPLHVGGDLDVLHLDDADLDAPGRRRLVDDPLQDLVDLVALGEQLVEHVLTEHRPQRRLGDLRGRDHEVLDLYLRGVRVHDPEVGDGVHADRDVVLRDHLLRRHVERDGAEIDLRHLIDERDDQEQARALGNREQPTQSEDHAALVLPRDLDGQEQEQHDDHDDCCDHDQRDIHQGPSSSLDAAWDPTSRRRSGPDLFDSHPAPRDERRVVDGACAPELSVQRHQPAVPHDALLADEAVGADEDGVPAGPDDPRDGEPEKQRERPGDREGDRGRDLVRGAGWVEEHERTEHERHPSCHRQGAVRRNERLGDEEGRGEQQQQHAGGRDRQDLEAVEPEDQGDRTDRPREDQPGMPQLDDDADQPDREKERDQVGIDEEVPSPLEEGHVDVLDLGVRRLEDVALGDGLHAVDLPEERGQRRRDDLDEADLLGLTRTVVRRLRDHQASRGDVPIVLAGQLADVGGGVVDDLATQVAPDVLPAEVDGRGRADVRLRRHRGEVGGHRDDRPGGVGARSRRCHVDDHGHRRRQEALDDPAHRGAQPAGVSRTITTAASWSRSARSMESSRYPCVTGLMSFEKWTASTRGRSFEAARATEDANPSARSAADTTSAARRCRFLTV